jgi:hypothetical protein
MSTLSEVDILDEHDALVDTRPSGVVCRRVVHPSGVVADSRHEAFDDAKCHAEIAARTQVTPRVTVGTWPPRDSARRELFLLAQAQREDDDQERAEARYGRE